MTDRIEVSRIPDGSPEPDRACYTITAEDVGRREIRLAIGETIVIADVYPHGLGKNSRAGVDKVRAEDTGRRLYGHANRGMSGHRWYWSTSEDR